MADTRKRRLAIIKDLQVGISKSVLMSFNFISAENEYIRPFYSYLHTNSEI